MLTATFATIIAWWISTGVMLFLIHRPTETYRRSLAICSVVTLSAFLSLNFVANTTSVQATYIGFAQAILIWAWLEMSYMMGIVTGPNKRPCPSHASELTRFWLGLGTSLYHELAVIIAGLTIYSLTFDAPNRTCWWVFLVLWTMRWSVKLNIFLGVANLNTDWFPAHLQYLASYVRKRSMNVLFPITMLLGMIAVLKLLLLLMNQDSPHVLTAHTLALTLLMLALLEHIFLVLPVNDSALWRWFQVTAPAPKKLSSQTPS